VGIFDTFGHRLNNPMLTPLLSFRTLVLTALISGGALLGLKAQGDSTVWHLQASLQATRFNYPTVELSAAEFLETGLKPGFTLGASLSIPFAREWLEGQSRFEVGLNLVQGGSLYRYVIEAPQLEYRLRQRITTFAAEIPFALRYQITENQAGQGFFLRAGGYFSVGLGGFYRRQLSVPVNTTDNVFDPGFNLAGVQHVVSINRSNVNAVLGSDVLPLNLFDLGMDGGLGYCWGRLSLEVRFLYSLQSIDPPVAIINASYQRLNVRHQQLRVVVRYRLGQ